jgi:CubicO group peptidase (beta-lactamase class C family)
MHKKQKTHSSTFYRRLSESGNSRTFLWLYWSQKARMIHNQNFRITCILMLLGSFTRAQGLNKAILDTIIEKGRQTHSNAIIFIQNNKVLVEEYYDQKPKPEYIASAGKSLVALAIGKLIDDGKIKSPDQPVYEFYPEWKQGTKKDITIRMLLNHTSGLQNFGDASIELEPPPLYRAKDIIQLALCAEVSDKPGTVFSYNNKAVALLGGIIEKASGQPLDKYFQENFYKPMNIEQFDWIRDQAGNPTAHGAFIIKPMDFAKFGLLMLNKGVYNGQRIISENWVRQCVEPAQQFDLRFGLLWWRILKFDKRVFTAKNLKFLEDAHISPDIIAKLRPMLNDTLSYSDYSKQLAGTFGDDWYAKIIQANNIPVDSFRVRMTSEDALAFYANGYRGNYLVIIPSLNLIAVRVRGNGSDWNPATDDFAEFVELVSSLAK